MRFATVLQRAYHTLAVTEDIWKSVTFATGEYRNMRYGNTASVREETARKTYPSTYASESNTNFPRVARIAAYAKRA